MKGHRPVNTLPAYSHRVARERERDHAIEVLGPELVRRVEDWMRACPLALPVPISGAISKIVKHAGQKP